MAWGKRGAKAEKGEAVVIVTMDGGDVVTSPPMGRGEAALAKSILLGEEQAGHGLSGLSWLPGGFDASRVSGVDVRPVSAPALDSAPFPGSISY